MMFGRTQKKTIESYGLNPDGFEFSMDIVVFSLTIGNTAIRDLTNIYRSRYNIAKTGRQLPLDVMEDIFYSQFTTAYAHIALNILDDANLSTQGKWPTEIYCRLSILLNVLKKSWTPAHTNRVTLASARDEIREWELARNRIGKKTAAPPKKGGRFTAVFDPNFDLDLTLNQLYHAETTPARVAILQPMSFTDWHCIAPNIPWDDSSILDVPEWIVEQAQCDLATAVLLLLYIDPTQFEDQNGAIGHLRPGQLRYHDLAKTAHSRIADNFYSNRKIEILNDNKRHLATLQDVQKAGKNQRWALPEYVFRHFL